MTEPRDKTWGLWVPWCKHEIPKDLKDCRFQAVYINLNGDLMNDESGNNDRHKDFHLWKDDVDPRAITLAYRKEVKVSK
jgi:hypothetical protein